MAAHAQEAPPVRSASCTISCFTFARGAGVENPPCHESRGFSVRAGRRRCGAGLNEAQIYTLTASLSLSLQPHEFPSLAACPALSATDALLQASGFQSNGRVSCDLACFRCQVHEAVWSTRFACRELLGARVRPPQLCRLPGPREEHLVSSWWRWRYRRRLRIQDGSAAVKIESYTFGHRCSHPDSTASTHDESALALSHRAPGMRSRCSYQPGSWATQGRA